MREYPRFLTPDFKPFNPLELARQTELIVARRRLRAWRGSTRTFTLFQFIGGLRLVMVLVVVCVTFTAGPTGQGTSQKNLESFILRDRCGELV